MSNKATRQQGNKATRQQGNKATRQQCNKATMQHDNGRIRRVQGFAFPGFAAGGKNKDARSSGDGGRGIRAQARDSTYAGHRADQGCRVSTGCKHCDELAPRIKVFQRWGSGTFRVRHIVVKVDGIFQTEKCTAKPKPTNDLIGGVYKNGEQIA